jgi:hypothetical protein
MIHIIIDNHSFHIQPEQEAAFYNDLLSLGPDAFKTSAEPMSALIQNIARSENPRVRETAAEYIYSSKTRAERHTLRRVAMNLAKDPQIDVKRALCSNENTILGKGLLTRLIQEGDIGILENIAESLDWIEQDSKEDLERLLIDSKYFTVKDILVSNTSTSTKSLRLLAEDDNKIISKAAWKALQSTEKDDLEEVFIDVEEDDMYEDRAVI